MMKKDGFTLIEAVFVIMIGGVLIPSILLGLGMSVKRNSDALAMYRNVAIAESIMREEMDEMIGLPYDDSRLNTVTNRGFDVDEDGFLVVYSVSYVDDELDSSVSDVGYKRISVQVSTPDERTYTLNAIVTSWQ